MRNAHGTRGFTLVEMIVSVGLFAVVMIVSVTALMSLISANQKAQALQSVMNNLNVTIDSMVRALREGTLYECGGTTPVDGDSGGNDCLDGETYLSFIPYGADLDNAEAWIYSFDTGTGRIVKSENGGSTYLPLTSSDIQIDSMTFYVVGAARGAADPDNAQPKVLIVIKGTAGSQNVKTRTTFHVQATAVQRVLDI